MNVKSLRGTALTWGLCPALVISGHSIPPAAPYTEQPKFVAELFTPVETMGRVSPPHLQERRRQHLLNSLPDVSVIFRLRDPTPASGGQTSWFPISPAELIEKRYLQVNKALFFFSKKYLYLHNKIWAAFPWMLLPSGAAAGLCSEALLDSTLMASSAASGIRMVYFSVFSFPWHLSAQPRLYLQYGPGRSGFAFTQPSLRARKGGVEHTQPSLKYFQVAKPTFGADNTSLSLKKTVFSTRSACLGKQKSDWPGGERTSPGAARQWEDQ